jgi:hypothetical protein
MMMLRLDLMQLLKGAYLSAHLLHNTILYFHLAVLKMLKSCIYTNIIHHSMLVLKHSIYTTRSSSKLFYA